MSERAILYTRVSTEEQAKGYSLQTQLERCQDFALQKGYSVVEEVEDRHSGEDLERPGLERLFQIVQEHRIQIVVVYDIDRLSRAALPIMPSSKCAWRN